MALSVDDAISLNYVPTYGVKQKFSHDKIHPTFEGYIQVQYLTCLMAIEGVNCHIGI